MTRESNQKAKRPTRQPLGQRNILTVAGRDPSYHYRWVNQDEGGQRIQMFKDAGFEIVTQDLKAGDDRAGEASAMGSVVTKQVGGGTVAHLMRISKDWYAEDQQAKEAKLKELESTMKPNETLGQYGDVKRQTSLGTHQADEA